MDEMRRQVADEEFERLWLPFFSWAIEQGTVVFARAYAYALAMAQYQRGERQVSFGGIAVPDLWGFLLVTAALREMAQAAGFAALANECERARADVAELEGITVALVMEGLCAILN